MMNAMGMQAQRGAYGGGDDIANLCTTPCAASTACASSCNG